jgi:hypothetical protein
MKIEEAVKCLINAAEGRKANRREIKAACRLLEEQVAKLECKQCDKKKPAKKVERKEL